jgi:hypothetical protein
MVQQQMNPYFDMQTYAPEEWKAYQEYANTQTGRRGGLFGAFDRVGKVFENNVTQKVAPVVHKVTNALNTPGGLVAMVALMAGIPYFPGMTEASLAAAAEAAGISSAELASYVAAAESEIATGGITGGTSGMIPGGVSATAAAAPSVVNSLIPSAATTTAAASGLSNYLTPALGAAAQLYGQQQANNAISDAANTAAASADKNLAFQREMFNTIRADQEPFRAAGVSALGKLSPLMDYKKFSMNDFMEDPGYQFRLTQGQQALDRSAAARAGLQSGAALKAATEFGQKMGSEEFNNAFNRYGIERERAINPLLSMAGFGQTATNNLQTGATNYGNTAGQIMQNAGNTQANAQLARGSVYADTGNELMKMLTRYKV